MKRVTITCDTCKKVINDECIRLGSELENDLCFDNKLATKPGEVKYLSKHPDLHFCSKEHFYKYFFNQEL